MADEPENLVVEMLRRLDAKVDGVVAEQQAMKTEQTAMRAEQQAMKAEQTAMRAEQQATNTKLDRLSARVDIMDIKLDRAAIRADDVMGAQARMATDIAALRAIQEEGGRTLVDGVRQDLESLRERVEALERHGS
jgi:hypothetical protein